MADVDMLLIGSGQAANPLAVAAANAGKRTMLVEQGEIGGTCVNRGCTPTKTLIASGLVAYLGRRAADFGIDVGSVSVDMPAVRERKRRIVDEWRSGSERSLASADNLEVVFGHARFTGSHAVEIALREGGTRSVSADVIVIDTGERPAPLAVDGEERVTILTSTTILELDEVPEHLLIVGAGPIGLEFGQLYRRLGAEVTMLQRSDRILRHEEPEIAAAITDILGEDGITVLTKATMTSVAKAGDGIDATITVDGGEQRLHVSHLLAAAGRVPNTDDLGLDAAGVNTDDRGYIPTSDGLETNVNGVYAVGDVRPGLKFTHISYDDYRILNQDLLGDGGRSVRDRLEPYTVFIDPQLGRVGMTEKQARDAGKRVKVATMPMSSVARALETSEPRGMMKVVVDAEDGLILGASILGIEGGEICSMLQIAMMGGVTASQLRDGVFPHPGLAEGFNNVFA